MAALRQHSSTKCIGESGPRSIPLALKIDILIYQHRTLAISRPDSPPAFHSSGVTAETRVMQWRPSLILNNQHAIQICVLGPLLRVHKNCSQSAGPTGSEELMSTATRRLSQNCLTQTAWSEGVGRKQYLLISLQLMRVSGVQRSRGKGEKEIGEVGRMPWPSWSPSICGQDSRMAGRIFTGHLLRFMD